jgi:hypothetical protein
MTPAWLPAQQRYSNIAVFDPLLIKLFYLEWHILPCNTDIPLRVVFLEALQGPILLAQV